MTMPTTGSLTTKRHPIRGFLYGIPFGLGLAMIAIGQKWAALGTWPPVILIAVGILVSIAWSTFGPAKGAKAPAAHSSAEAAPESDEVSSPQGLTGDNEKD